MIPANPLVQVKGGGGAGGGSGDVTGPASSTDNAVPRFDGTGGKTLQDSPLVVGDAGQLTGGLLGNGASSGGATLAAEDSGKLVSILSGGGADSVTLPASPTVGTWYDFIVVNTDELTIQSTGAQVIRIGSSVSAAGGTAVSSTRGSRVNLVYGPGGQWFGIASGTWTLS